MNIWLKEISVEDGEEFCNCLLELARYPDAYARPVPSDFTEEEFEGLKETRVKMFNGIPERPNIPRTNTYWVMDGERPIGYATLKHTVDMTKPGGHFGCCLIKEYQNKGVGTIVSNLLSEIAVNEIGLEEVLFTSKDENIQSQKSVEKMGGRLIGIHDGYHFYMMNIKEKLEERGRKLW